MKNIKQKIAPIAILAVALSSFCVYPAFADNVSASQSVKNVKQSSAKSTDLNQIIDNDTNLSPKVKLEYKKFITKKAKIANANNYIPTKQDIDEFVTYAAKNGIIDNTTVSTLSITKSLVRASMKIVAAGGGLVGFDLSEELLDHSLQDNPGILVFRDSQYRWECESIRKSPKYQQVLSSLYSTLKNTTSASYTKKGLSMTLKSPTDLYLAVDNVNYDVYATKSNGKWNVTIYVSDTYNFEYWPWKNVSGLKGAAGTALNNYGQLAQSIGAVVPYYVQFDLHQTYTP